ncbi:MAG: hypothetical protein Q8L98_01325 [Chlamydiales bacterium]|nr:hypothetical protein [Chlamydiales bacterium]
MNLPPLSFFGNIPSCFPDFSEEPEDIDIEQAAPSQAENSLINDPFQRLHLPKNSEGKVEQCVVSAITRLMCENGKLLKKENIFQTPVSTTKMAMLQRNLPRNLDTNDPYLLAGFLKASFQTDEYRSKENIEFLPKEFSSEDFDQLTTEIQEDPDWVKGQLSFFFSKQSECVKFFILLLKKTSQFKKFNKMGIERLAALINPFLTAYFSSPKQRKSSTILAKFIIEHAEEIFSEITPSFNELAPPVLRKVEDAIHEVIDLLNANEGKLLETESIFIQDVPLSEIKRLQKTLSSNFNPEEESPHLLARLLTTLFHKKIKDETSRQIRFLPDTFTFVDFTIVINFLEKDPSYLENFFHNLFSTQNECVKKFILLLKRTSHLKYANNVNPDELAAVLDPLLYAHFSDEEIAKCSPKLAQFIIEHAEDIFSEQIDHGKTAFIEPIDHKKTSDLSLDYNNWFIKHIKNGEISSSADTNEYVNPSEALKRIRRLLLLVPHARSYINNKESLLENIDRLRLYMIDLDCLDEDDRLIHDQISAMKKTLKVFQDKIESKKNLGAQLNHELNDLIKTKYFDVPKGLRNLENKYQQIKNFLMKMELNFWDSSLTLIDPNEQDLNQQQKLISQSRISENDWSEIFQKDEYLNLEYGPSQVAKKGELSEDTDKTFLAKQMISSLDYYLFNLGYSSDTRLNIYKHLQQDSKKLFNPTTVTRDFIASAAQSDGERFLKLESRYEAYCLAYWRSGWTEIPSMKPGSKLDTHGFATYVNSRDFKEVPFKKVLLSTLDLKTNSVISDYLFQFRNPFSKKLETHYYRAIHQFEILDTSFEALPSRKFPNLEKLRELPKFILQRPENSPKSKEAEKEAEDA